MKASYEWLKEFCEFDLPAHELAGRLSHSGLGIETYEPRGDDWMLDVEVKSNRPDCLSHLGIAREVAAVTGGTVRRPELKASEDADRAFTDLAAVEVTAPDLCPHYTARVVTGVSVGPSPDWMQRRLETCGVRPVNNVVDVTNYVMLECGQPLHAFDLALIGGRRIVVRQAAAGEVLTTIDGTEVRLNGDECVIADESKPIAMAGIMGGLESEICETTVDVLLEAARFHPGSVRRSSRAHGLSSESSYRFERGIDPEITDWASRRACQLIVELAGGDLLQGSADIRADTTSTPEVTMRHSRLALVLGIRVDRDEVEGIFRGLGLEVPGQDEASITVRVPSWRGDLRREIDLIEEVARIHGYDRIGETTRMPVRAAQPDVADVVQRRARRFLAGQGFNEVMTYSLVAPTDLQLSQPWHDGAPVAVRNPVSAERTHLRLTNMANILRVKGFNQARGTERVNLAELGHVYIPRPGEHTPEEKLCLTLLTDENDGLRLLKGVLENLLLELGVTGKVEEKPGCAGPFDPEQALTLRLGDAPLGGAGVVSDRIAEDLDLRAAPALMELDFGVLTAACRLDRPYEPIPPYPATRRDLAIAVAEDVLWADVEACVRQSAPAILESIALFDIYRGQGVPEGQKSVAFSLTFRRGDRTITSEEAEQAREAILAALEGQLNARLR